MEKNSGNSTYSYGINLPKVLKHALIDLSLKNKETLKACGEDYAGLNFHYIDNLPNDKLRQQASYLTGKLNGSWKFSSSQAHYLIVSSPLFSEETEKLIAFGSIKWLNIQ